MYWNNIENDDNKGKLESIPEDSIEEWEMIEEVLASFDEDCYCDDCNGECEEECEEECGGCCCHHHE